jgi:hypothetical protein
MTLDRLHIPHLLKSPENQTATGNFRLGTHLLGKAENTLYKCMSLIGFAS